MLCSKLIIPNFGMSACYNVFSVGRIILIILFEILIESVQFSHFYFLIFLIFEVLFVSSFMKLG